MKKILLSIAVLGIVGAAIGGVTIAFYGDVERSTGNTFTAGGIDLKVDSVAHYNDMVCVDGTWQPNGITPGPEHFPQPGMPCEGSWEETDLDELSYKFFYYPDLKPGDEGENTISLHVYDNDALGQFEIVETEDKDNTCTDSEQTAENDLCEEPDGDGEIDEYLLFTGWLDQGLTPGFQCGDDGAECQDDPQEGDNIHQPEEGPTFWTEEPVSGLGPFALSEVLSAAYAYPYPPAPCIDPDGNTGYEYCHGLAEDGRMVESVTYYFGIKWELPLMETGNDAQTDSYIGDLIFRVEQHRNNTNPFSGS